MCTKTTVILLQVTDSIVVPVDSKLLVRTAELLSGGQVGSVLFECTVTIATVTSMLVVLNITTISNCKAMHAYHLLVVNFCPPTIQGQMLFMLSQTHPFRLV